MTTEIENYTGALGPMSNPEWMHYDLELNEDGVRLIGPVGCLEAFSKDEFERLVSEGEWILADIDYEEEVYHTPDEDIEW